MLTGTHWQSFQPQWTVRCVDQVPDLAKLSSEVQLQSSILPALAEARTLQHNAPSTMLLGACNWQFLQRVPGVHKRHVAKC